MNEYILTRRQVREAALIYFYQYFIEEKFAKDNKQFFNLARFIKENMESLNYILKEKFKTEKEVNVINNELFISLVEPMNDVDKIIGKLEEHLDESWQFNRLNVVEQALLVTSYIQIKYIDIEKTIVINEAIELAKEYCDDESYKYINGVLDKI